MKEDLNMNHFEFKHQDSSPQLESVNSISLVHVVTAAAHPRSSSISTPPPLGVSIGGTTSSSSGGGGFKRVPMSNKNVKKPRSKCARIFLCTPSKLYLMVTIALTTLASLLLWFSLTSEYWEIMVYNHEKVDEMIKGNETLSSHVTVSWHFDGKVPKILFDDRTPPDHVIFLLPIRSGLWTSCIDLTEVEYEELTLLGYDKPHCVDHLQSNASRPIEIRASWQHRMQNLAIACATVCLILLGSAVFVGLFGVFRPQISAVLVTGVIYMLAALFAVFTLAIVYLKHKNRREREPLDVWSRLIPENDEDFQTTRAVYQGWSLKLAWAGNFVCIVASVMWVILSKIMRYNPNPLSLISAKPY